MISDFANYLSEVTIPGSAAFLSALILLMLFLYFLAMIYYGSIVFYNEPDYFSYRNRIEILDMRKFISKIYSPDKQSAIIKEIKNFVENPQIYSSFEKIKRNLSINPKIKVANYNVLRFDKINRKIYKEIRITKSKIDLIDSFERRVSRFIDRHSDLDSKCLSNGSLEDLKQYLDEMRHVFQAYLNTLQEFLSHLQGIHYQNQNIAKNVSMDMKNSKK